MPVSQTLPDISLYRIVKRKSEKIWLPVWQDWDEEPIVTDAGLLPIIPTYEPVAVAVYHIVQFKPYSDAEFNAEINAINSDNWGAWTPGQCWISEIHSNGTEQKGAGIGEDVNYVIRCIDKPYGWKIHIPNAGYAYKDGSTLKSFSASGTPYIGNLVEATGAGTAGTTLNFKDFRTKKEIPFMAIIGLS